MKHQQTLLLFAFLLTAVLFGILWLIDFSGYNIPEYIPNTNLNLYGIFTLAIFIFIFTLFQKKILKEDNSSSIKKLVILSVLITIVGEAIYQGVRQMIMLQNSFDQFFKSFIISSLVGSFVAISVALELKKIKPIWNFAFVFLLLSVLYFIVKNSNHLEW